MQVGHTGQQDRVAFVAGQRGSPRFDGRDTSIGLGEPHIVVPASGKECLFRKDRCHFSLRLSVSHAMMALAVRFNMYIHNSHRLKRKR